MHTAAPPAASDALDDAEVFRRFRVETAREIARRLPFAVALFLSMMSIAFAIEWWYHPGRLLPLSVCYGALTLSCAAALYATRRALASARTVTVLTVLALAAILALYLALVNGSGELLLLAMIGYLTGVVVQFPWGASGQSLAAAAVLALFTVAATLGVSHALPFPYAMFALATHAIMTVFGAHLLQTYRWTAFREAASSARSAQRSGRASQAKSEFLSNISHELRTPLNIIFGYTDLLLDEGFTDAAERRDALLRIRAQSGHLLDMIQTMLDIDRIEEGRIPIERTNFTVDEMIERLRVNIPDGWMKDGVELSWETAADGAVMSSDRGKIEMIVRNLVHNALKYTDRGSVRVVAHSPAKSRLRVSVEDTGRGIPREDVDRVFERFGQSRHGPSREGSFGLGLFLVKQLTELLGGDIEVSSEVGVGSRFSVTLPLVAPSQAEDEPRRARAV